MLERVLRAPAPVRWVLGLALVVTLLVVNRLAHLSAGVIRDENAIVQRAELMYVPNDTVLSVLTLGYKQTAADVLWLRTLGYFARHFESDRQYAWLEHFIDQVLRFDPKFRRVYFWAGANVLYGRQFTNENVMLSNRFYEKALVQFPDDYQPPYRLGLNYYIELQSSDPEERDRFRQKGLEYLELAANRPTAPDSIKSLVAGISNKLGKTRLALQYLTDLYLVSTDPEQRAALAARIEKLERSSRSSTEFAEAARVYREDWQRLYGFAPPTLHGLMGEPDIIEQPDVDWRTLAGVAAGDP
ncbi:MAG: hypothetical protein KC613_19860 [Myxococcales bacterium]|nr:hypothetical protein [Myxococcales bacterium]MCB9524966.1 hypothetical protein [Myxococcales bacterium]